MRNTALRFAHSCSRSRCTRGEEWGRCALTSPMVNECTRQIYQDSNYTGATLKSLYVQLVKHRRWQLDVEEKVDCLRRKFKKVYWQQSEKNNGEDPQAVSTAPPKHTLHSEDDWTGSFYGDGHVQPRRCDLSVAVRSSFPLKYSSCENRGHWEHKLPWQQRSDVIWTFCRQPNRLLASGLFIIISGTNRKSTVSCSAST